MAWLADLQLRHLVPFLGVVATFLFFSDSIGLARPVFDALFLPAPQAASPATVETNRPRGNVTDAGGQLVAYTGTDFQVSVTPNRVADPTGLAKRLAPILDVPAYQIQMRSQTQTQTQTWMATSNWVLLASRVSPDTAAQIQALNEPGLVLEPMPRRFKPEGRPDLLCHLLGFVNYDNRGQSGVEAYYDALLTGAADSQRDVLLANFGVPQPAPTRAMDLVLTIDSDVQAAVARHLRDALDRYKAPRGTIIVMDPGSGAILGLANSPCYEPERFYEEGALLIDPAVSHVYEPGGVFQLITMAMALDFGIVQPETMVNDSGVYEVEGFEIHNWDNAAPGPIAASEILSRASNVGAATLANGIGPLTYYNYLRRFGFGRPTGVDLAAESPGLMPVPGDLNWSEGSLARNAFGQSIAVTPLQMISAVSAIANGGQGMVPYVVAAVVVDGKTYSRLPREAGRPITGNTAARVTAMAVASAGEGAVDGYQTAGKAGTAQIPDRGIYDPEDTIASYIGWFPADDPEVIILVKLDRPQTNRWGHLTAAPTFAGLAEELAVLLEVEPNQ